MNSHPQPALPVEDVLPPVFEEQPYYGYPEGLREVEGYTPKDFLSEAPAPADKRIEYVGLNGILNVGDGDPLLLPDERLHTNKEWAKIAFYTGAVMLAAYQQNIHSNESIHLPGVHQPAVVITAEQGHDDQSIYKQLGGEQGKHQEAPDKGGAWKTELDDLLRPPDEENQILIKFDLDDKK